MHHGIRGYIRSMTRRYFSSRCTVQVETVGRGEFGENAAYWSNIAEDVPCRILPAGQGDTERAVEFTGQDSIREMKRLIVSHDFALDVGQRVVIGEDHYQVASLLFGATDEAFRACVLVRMVGTDG